MNNKFALHFPMLACLILLASCDGGGSGTVHPNQGAFTATIDGQNFDAVPKKLTVTLNPSNQDAFSIDAGRAASAHSTPPAGDIETGHFVIYINQNVVPGFVGSYDESDGFAEIQLDSADIWSTVHNGGSFSLEITQLDLANKQASGNFAFTAKKAAGDPAVMEVTDGAFLLIGVDDIRP